MDINKIIVHAGVFHADDAMCAAIAQMVAEAHGHELETERTFRAPQEISEGTVVCDIGGKFIPGKMYDHHQEDAPVRENGDKHAACGLLLEDCWQDIFPTYESYKAFDENIIHPIERADNGVERNPLSLSVSSHVPSWDSNRSIDDAFTDAVQEMRGLLEREVERAKSAERAKGIVTEALGKAENGVVTLPQFCPWQDTLIPSDAQLVIFPSNRGGYNVQCVPDAPGSFGFKVEGGLPEQWLAENPEGCTFVHQNRFMAAFDTLEHAQDAAVSVIQAQEQEHDRKYRLTEETKIVSLLAEGVRAERSGARGVHTLHRIEAVKDFGSVKAGEKGGWIEKEENLSQEGLCWVSGEAEVLGSAIISGNARVTDESQVYEKASVYGDALISGHARVRGTSKVQGAVGGYAHIHENAQVHKGAVTDQAWVSGNAVIGDSVYAYEHAHIYGNAKIQGNVFIEGGTRIGGETVIHADDLLEININPNLPVINGDIRDGESLWNAVTKNADPYRLMGQYRDDMRPQAIYDLARKINGGQDVSAEDIREVFRQTEKKYEGILPGDPKKEKEWDDTDIEYNERRRTANKEAMGLLGIAEAVEENNNRNGNLSYLMKNGTVHITGGNLVIDGVKEDHIESIGLCPPLSSDGDIMFDYHAVEGFAGPIICSNLTIRDCPGCKELPEGLDVRHLNIQGSGISELPEDARIAEGMVGPNGEELTAAEIYGENLGQEMQEPDAIDTTDMPNGTDGQEEEL